MRVAMTLQRFESLACARTEGQRNRVTEKRMVAAEIRKINCMSNFQWQPSFNIVPHGSTRAEKLRIRH